MSNWNHHTLGSVHGYTVGYRQLSGKGQRKGQCSCCTLTPQMIAHHDELSLLDKAGSQVDKGRAWRHKLQLALSAFIASCRMNKLTSCHNISKWISGDLASKCAHPLYQCYAECAHCSLWKHPKMHCPVCHPFFHMKFCYYIFIIFQSHDKQVLDTSQQWVTVKWNWKWGQTSPWIRTEMHRTCV